MSETKSDVANESIIACGNACIGLGEAIKGLSKLGLIAEALELAEQLKLNAKSLRWLIREDRNIAVSGKTDDVSLSSSEVENWLKEFLGTSQKAARDVLESGQKAGFEKGQIFQARASLGLRIIKRNNLQFWSLPSEMSANGAT